MFVLPFGEGSSPDLRLRYFGSSAGSPQARLGTGRIERFCVAEQAARPVFAFGYAVAQQEPRPPVLRTHFVGTFGRA